MKRVSIVIPVHNRAALTERCLDLVLAEDEGGAAPEVIVVDDGSTDTTPDLLAGYGERIRVVTHAEATGFAGACNDGAEAVGGDYLVFLNNDTVPRAGWLDALVRYAEDTPLAAVVGAKLLYPDGTVQHAGVVVCQDGLPRHVYAGFPADHPAVSRSRRFQAVTAACALVRADPFRAAGGFDPAFVNGFEDVDLCLRLSERGWEVHYCHESVLTHLESATRSLASADGMPNLRRYRERWGERAERDDLRVYAEDGLLRLGYGGGYPLSLSFSPLLGMLEEGGREADELLGARARQVSRLLGEVVRLTVRAADAGLAPDAGGGDNGGRKAAPAPVLPLERHADLVREHADIEDRIYALQRALAGRHAQPSLVSDELAYRDLVRQVHEVIQQTVPARSTVLVASRGDSDLIDLAQRTGWHFPQDERGVYAGSYPADGTEAVAALETLRSRGATHLVFPATALWWLDHYRELSEHLADHARELVWRSDVCAVFHLVEPSPREGSLQRLPVVRTLAPGDGMFASGPNGYFRWGRAALLRIQAVLAAAKRERVATILDLPCGHGRVLRWLAAAFPDARIVACDLDRDGVNFCAATFDAAPVYSRERAEDIEVDDAFELIWVGSLLTHLDAPRWREFLAFLESHLVLDGVLALTYHGPHVAETVRSGKRKFYVRDTEALLRDYDEAGFGYQDYAAKDGYGISLAHPDWVRSLLDEYPGLGFVAQEPGSAEFRHDVLACVRREAAYA